MINYNKLLEEANKATVNYPEVIRPAIVWRIRQKSPATGYFQPKYLSFSFVLDKNLKLPELGFNLVLNNSLNQRPICFLSEKDANIFYEVYKNKCPDLHIEDLIVAGGRGGDDLIRINRYGDIPVYGNKSNIEYRLSYDNNKVPQYVKDKMTLEVSVPDDVRKKEQKKQQEYNNWVAFKFRFKDAIESLPGFISFDDSYCNYFSPEYQKGTYNTGYFFVYVNMYVAGIETKVEMKFEFKKDKLLLLRAMSAKNVGNELDAELFKLISNTSVVVKIVPFAFKTIPAVFYDFIPLRSIEFTDPDISLEALKKELLDYINYAQDSIDSITEYEEL